MRVIAEDKMKDCKIINPRQDKNIMKIHTELIINFMIHSVEGSQCKQKFFYVPVPSECFNLNIEHPLLFGENGIGTSKAVL